MNYSLNNRPTDAKQGKAIESLKKMWPLVAEEKGKIVLALFAMLVNAGVNLSGPLLMGHAVDTYIQQGDEPGLLWSAAVLFGLFVIGLIASYLQTNWMGGVGQRTLFRLRNIVFAKLQSLPVAFFNQNKAGDLISRINNDTDKLNQFFSQSLMQFIGNIFLMLGAGGLLLWLNPGLGSASLAPALGLLIFTQITSAWVKRQNTQSMKSLGGLSSEIQESLNNFKVIIAFNRRDYFRKRFQDVNEDNYKNSIGAGLANNLFTPIFGLVASLAQLIVLAYGIYLVTTGTFTIGLLISFLAYVNHFYNPLRHMAALWTSFQTALAGWDRVSEILELETDLPKTIEAEATNDALLEFNDVEFTYPEGTSVLHHVNFRLEKGKTYALVGPTGGGKTTTASLMARLYDPTTGTVLLHGRDIRSYDPTERSKKIGFILQEPFLFSGTVRDNILYGNDELAGISNEDLAQIMHDANLEQLLARFDQGLETPLHAGGDGVSLGQKQLIAFMRAVLRKPELLILDEATANIDTVTEQLLEHILKKLPKETTRVIIAHRLNTIEEADEIFFVNSGEVTRAGSLQHAVDLLLDGKRSS